MANFNQVSKPLVRSRKFAESLNDGLNTLLPMTQTDFVIAAQEHPSKASAKLGIESRELTAGKSRLEYFIKTLRPGGSDNPQLRLAWDPDGHAHHGGADQARAQLAPGGRPGAARPARASQTDHAGSRQGLRCAPVYQ